MAEIPTYPVFTPVSDHVKDHVYDVTARYAPYSDFNYVNMLAWNLHNGVHISLLHDNLAVRMSDYISGEAFYSFLGDNRPVETASQLLDTAEREAIDRTLRLVPEVAVSALEASGLFNVAEDSAEHDYILSLPDIAAMEGRRFQVLRQSVGYFATEYGEAAEFVELDVAEPQSREAMLHVFSARHSLKDSSGHGHDSRNELLAIGRLFKHIDPTTVRSYGIRVHDKLAAFMIYEPHGSKWSTAHFWKADTRYKGIYRAFMHRIATEMSAEGAVYMNFEQDLGIIGLKLMKKSLNPVAQLRKYTVTDALSALPGTFEKSDDQPAA